ncbi:actin-like protein 6A-like protein [Gonapodya prolifera JEL478]|uniref:Actin-like protein 6A-like protein n=1 Tax=Gonapodya prolifera (strain JEL478) TaxID=1344416 RepID=A0A139AVW1_GONPJ|nr:actin-like protein 6A-like protein [Gonapodya prolifera JEL478]|eukprot:KXS20872.1 actin-like protein 6A-like protein [Gonapodya prolifera JEL478]
MAPGTFPSGGDDVSAIVLDPGSSWTRAGWAGEDMPRSVFPSYVGMNSDHSTSVSSSAAMEEDDLVVDGMFSRRRPKNPRYSVGENVVGTWRPNFELTNPFRDGLVQDWDIFEQLIDHALYDLLRADPAQHPILFTEPAWNSRDVREKLTEIMFETYNVPAFFIAKDAVLSAFAHGKASGLVVNSGGATTSVVPVYEGYAIKKALSKQMIGGDFLSNQARLTLQQHYNIQITPQYLVKRKAFVDPGKAPEAVYYDRPSTASSFHRYQVLRTINDWKETVCQVSEVFFHEESLAGRPAKSYEFPNGANNTFGADRFRIPEIMFDPRLSIPDSESPVPSDALGLQQLVQNSIQSCDPDIRTVMYGSIILTGGNTCFAGFTDRMSNELSRIAPGPKLRVQAVGSTAERRFSSWIGGSILASLGTFHQLWISRQEYEENGKQFVEKRCQ